ncbi:uroporphyrinogen decarboxylase [Hathewaya proteolytica DSM 3090]|uniref:Uroporphyrinogen decarboxylase n=1 Tax=Hathewaya proteolytica DSM 3090 TaxID=1121331 RepID=A0A1M6SDN4_9CLOT|nr:uroporphyrinogen decarboxylase family protein [Hathewaya proteolytica]SHK42785.1 uroporphyrinogen decarboxylase [Hathewaya proteolytica DSM 3090]
MRDFGENRRKEDELTSRERIELYFKGKSVDRIPCMPFLGESSTPMLGIDPSEQNQSAEIMAKMEIEAYRTFGHDSCGIGTGLRAMAEAMGAEVQYQKNRVPFMKGNLLNDYKDLNNLKRIDPHKDGRLPIILEALTMADKSIGKEVEVASDIAGPFSVAAFVRGTDNFLKDTIKDKENVHRLLEIVTENNIRYIDTVSSMGFSIGICDPVASLSMISKKQFREFALPYLKICLDRIKEKGVPGFIHICGKTKAVWNDLVDIGFETLSIDNCEDVAEAVEMVGDRVCVVGNVDPVDTMRFGTTEDVYNEATECIIKGINNPNKYILSTGCDVATGAPIENMYALLNAARDFKLK